MHKLGHYGAALLAYAPVAFLLLSNGNGRFAAIGGAVVVALSTVPDCDLSIPFLSHRGPTHTVGFVLLVGALVGVAGWYAAEPLGVDRALPLAVFLAAVAMLSIASHILADALTPMGVRPFWPLSGRSYTLSIVRADNWLANRLLLSLGAVAVAAVVAATGAVPIR